MTEATVIPVLPCRNLKEALEFYHALGFKITYQQHAPYVYGSVEREGIYLHFFGSKHQPATESGHMALVMVADADGPHGAFSAGLKAAYGKKFRSGIPRLETLPPNPLPFAFKLLCFAPILPQCLQITRPSAGMLGLHKRLS